MIEFISITRIITDYFWQYKFLSILHTMLPFALIAYITIKRKNLKLKIIDVDILIAALLTALFIAFALDANQSSLVELLKFIAYIAIYFAARLYNIKAINLKSIGVFSLISLIILFVIEITGRGYITWGHVSTFTGGYFFKTDLAIACLIFIVFIFATLKSKLALSIGLILSSYLIFKSNTRIALPLILIIPAFIMLANYSKLGLISLRNLAFTIVVTSTGVALFAIIDFNSIGLLGFDFSDPFSAANTQGRSVIWAALLDAYSDAPLLNKIFGSGLTADTDATRLYSASLQLAGVRAHNSFLYLLLCIGIAGSILFYWLMYLFLKKAHPLLMQSSSSLKVIPIISCSFIIMFFWLSLTTEVIIRPQLMILLFFFSGLHVQSYLASKHHESYI